MNIYLAEERHNDDRDSTTVPREFILISAPNRGQAEALAEKHDADLVDQNALPESPSLNQIMAVVSAASPEAIAQSETPQDLKWLKQFLSKLGDELNEAYQANRKKPSAKRKVLLEEASELLGQFGRAVAAARIGKRLIATAGG